MRREIANTDWAMNVSTTIDFTFNWCMLSVCLLNDIIIVLACLSETSHCCDLFDFNIVCMSVRIFKTGVFVVIAFHRNPFIYDVTSVYCMLFYDIRFLVYMCLDVK